MTTLKPADVILNVRCPIADCEGPCRIGGEYSVSQVVPTGIDSWEIRFTVWCARHRMEWPMTMYRNEPDAVWRVA